MTYRLAIDLASERVQAAIVEDSNVSWFDLADGGHGLLAAVHHGEDGTVVVGDAALDVAGRPGRFDPDPRGSLGLDEGALAGTAALLATAVERVEHQRGEPPELVMLAHPDDWPAAKTRALNDAARAAELESFERVSAGAAVDAYRRVSGDEQRPHRAIGYGAAIVAAGAPMLDATQATAVAGAAALVTLEDIAGPLPDPTPPVVPTYAADGPRSVFEQPAPSSPATQAMPVVPPVVPPSGPPPTEPPEEGGNRWLPWAVALGALALVLLLALIVVLLNDDGGSTVATNDSTTSVTGSTTSVPETSSSSTTGSTSTTSTTSTSTTSTTTSTTTTSTTTTSTTTTTLAPTPVEVVVDPLEIVINPAGPSVSIAMGDDGSFAVASLIVALGDPDADSGFQPGEQCLTENVRRVRWGGLELVLLDDANQSVGQWLLYDRFGEVPHRTSAGIGVGSTVAELASAYDDLVLEPAGGGLTEWIFLVTEPQGTIGGVTTGGQSADTITTMWSGDGCQTLFL